MNHNLWRFKKNGHIYSTTANNLLEAQWKLECLYGVNLKGAKWQKIWKTRLDGEGIVK